MDRIKEFTDLKVWQAGHQVVLSIHKMILEFPQTQKYILSDQMYRCVLSITANIAEGFGRQTYKDKLRFYYMAQGSVTELKNHLFVAKDFEYISIESFREVFDQVITTHKLLQGLIRKTREIIRDS